MREKGLPELPPLYEDVVNQNQIRPSVGSSSSSAPYTTDPNTLYTSNQNLPFRYPRNYFCKKCRNSGYKTKNGKICKDCWKAFAPERYYGIVGNGGPSGGPFNGSGPNPNVVPLPPGSLVMPNPNTRVVRPGDPSIGGKFCYNCKGSGLVSFFLDQDVCRQCNGVGRVFR